MYFECNLPEKAPYWLRAEIANDFDKMLSSVKARVKKLNEAHSLSGLSGENFAKQAKALFNMSCEKFDSMTASEIATFANLTFDGIDAEKRWEWPNATVIVDSAFVTTKEWQMIRHFGIGGSDASVVLGMSKYQTELQLYHTKVGTPELLAGKDNSYVFDRGHFMEDNVISAFCKLTGAKIIPETRMFASKKYPCCTANIDAIIIFPNGNVYVFEAKTTIAENFSAWSNGKIPGTYIPQMRQYPAVLSDDRIQGTFIGCLFTNDSVVNNQYIGSSYSEEKFVNRFMERDKDAEENQLKAEAIWFSEYVEMNIQPEMKGKPEDEIKVLRKYQGNSDPTIPVETWDDDEDIVSEVEKYLEAKKQKSELEAKVKALKEVQDLASLKLIEKLGKAVEANIELPNDMYYEIKNSPRRGIDVDTENLKVLIDTASVFLPETLTDSLRKCIIENPEKSRTFSIKIKKRKKAK